MKKALLWVVGIIAALCIAVACIWGGEIATIRSVKSVDGNEYLYTMEYKAAYDLDDVVANDIDENSELLDYVALPDTACALNEERGLPVALFLPLYQTVVDLPFHVWCYSLILNKLWCKFFLFP